MSRTARGLSAVDAIARGFVNLRANWEFVAAAVAQAVLATAVSVAAFLPLVLVLDMPALPALGEPGVDPRLAGAEWVEWMEATLLSVGGRGPAVLGALAACLVVLTMAFLVYCFFEGAILGILAAGDRQAPPGRPRAWPLFRTFSLHHLAGWGGRFLWRYFWLLSLIVAVALLWALLALALFVLMAWGAESWGPGGVAGIGCGGGLLLGALLLLIVMWSWVALADAAREGSGVGRAARRGLEVLGARLGAVTLATVLWLAVTMAVNLGLAPISLVLETAALGTLTTVALEAFVLFVQMVLGGAIGLVYVAALVALVVDHQRRLTADPAEGAH